MSEKKCTFCEQVKLLSDFPKKGHKCKQCTNKGLAEWRKLEAMNKPPKQKGRPAKKSEPIKCEVKLSKPNEDLEFFKKEIATIVDSLNPDDNLATLISTIAYKYSIATIEMTQFIQTRLD